MTIARIPSSDMYAGHKPAELLGYSIAVPHRDVKHREVRSQVQMLI